MTRVIRTVVVDDEPLARDGLRVRLGREDDVEIVGEAADGPSAVNAILSLRPDLVFLDVQIPGFDGFDVVAKTASTHLPDRCTVPKRHRPVRHPIDARLDRSDSD